MTYLLIAFVVLLALSPLISMMPSRRQRQIADLRQGAAVTGLFVELRSSPLEPPDSPRQPFYGCRRRREQQRPRGNTLYRRDGERWVTADLRPWSPARLELLEALPGGVSAVFEEPQSVGVYWDERGERADVECIARVLRDLLAQGSGGEN